MKGSVDAEKTDGYDLIACVSVGIRNRWVEGVISAYFACCLLYVMECEVPEEEEVEHPWPVIFI